MLHPEALMVNALRSLTHSDAPPMWFLWTILLALLTFVLWISLRSSEPYGLFHLAFNNDPSNTGAPQTEWLNMGFWKV